MAEASFVTVGFLLAPVAAAAPAPPELTVVFDGTELSKWTAVETGSVDDSGGALRLCKEYAVGAAEIDGNKLPNCPGNKVIVRDVITATGVVLDSDPYFLRSVTLRITCDEGGGVETTTTATLRAYKPERDSPSPTVNAILNREGVEKKETDLTNPDITGALVLSVVIKDGTTELVITDSDDTPHTLTLSSGKQGEPTACRVELAGNGPKGVRPSVERLELVLDVEDKP